MLRVRFPPRYCTKKIEKCSLEHKKKQRKNLSGPKCVHQAWVIGPLRRGGIGWAPLTARPGTLSNHTRHLLPGDWYSVCCNTWLGVSDIHSIPLESVAQVLWVPYPLSIIDYNALAVWNEQLSPTLLCASWLILLNFQVKYKPHFCCKREQLLFGIFLLRKF